MKAIGKPIGNVGIDVRGRHYRKGKRKQYRWNGIDQTEDESVGDLRDKEIRVADISVKVSLEKWDGLDAWWKDLKIWPAR